jgi:hypothetical protein
MKKIKNKKEARTHLARDALATLIAAQEALFEWGDEQELHDGDDHGEAAWTAIECLGEELAEVDTDLESLERALD